MTRETTTSHLRLVINGFTARGINMGLATAADLYVADTIVRNNGTGIFLASSSSVANVSKPGYQWLDPFPRQQHRRR